VKQADPKLQIQMWKIGVRYLKTTTHAAIRDWSNSAPSMMPVSSMFRQHASNRAQQHRLEM